MLQARNWTLGRPLRIRPSVRAAIGKGTRNLYNDTDAYKLSIANKLRHGGVGFRVIRYVIETVEPEQFVDGRADWLILSVTETHIFPHTALNEEIEEFEMVKQGFSVTEPIYYYVQLSDLLGEVVDRIKRYMNEHTPEEYRD